jgi:hypothetical protein
MDLSSATSFVIGTVDSMPDFVAVSANCSEKENCFSQMQKVCLLKIRKVMNHLPKVLLVPNQQGQIVKNINNYMNI